MAWPPELIDDATAEILIRLPPDEPAHLVRAVLVCVKQIHDFYPLSVCTSWRRILTDPAFLHRYRAFHGTPPLLGFFDVATGPYRVVPSFTPTVQQASPVPHRTFDCADWWTLDCRHGRVLFGLSLYMERLVVWDPITGDHQELPDPRIPVGNYTGAVLCSVRGCDHLSCHGGPFHVVLAGGYNCEDNTVRAHLYSSEAGTWIASTHLNLEPHVIRRPSACIGGDIYFQLSDSMILRYHAEKNGLSVIHPPAAHTSEGGIVLVPMEDGSLGLVGVRGSRLCLWSTSLNNPEGIAGWVRCGDVELMTGIPLMPYSDVYIVGSAEGLGIVFVATEVGRFAIELKSGRERKVDEPGIYYAIFPFVSFYTPGTMLAH
ncbi:hypothetical protein PR202_gb01166 [Eleusine coracana subsp. coracana]|uniref:F-box protein AT5G49610-like beta-propeller domain-containing protein n=1 Tax=Eleusine coracana subsp. coracana TaxID=191504 RepID=A0AAV5DVK7_ELECO|nr:hypothetical protein PR202_gb01166 [Eleusine coracana subsp. coracana]